MELYAFRMNVTFPIINENEVKKRNKYLPTYSFYRFHQAKKFTMYIVSNLKLLITLHMSAYHDSNKKVIGVSK